ncbi:Cytochrome P450 7B1 [Aphanomyces cochlioides]|nr:Cytochrome P450 7B1 [Aphanomyces cochlioides]
MGDAMSLLLVFLVGSLGLVAVSALMTRRPKAADSGIPFISSWVPYFGASWHFRRGRIAALLRWTREYGPVFSFTMLGQPVTCVTDASLFGPIIKSAALILQPLKTKILNRVFGASNPIDSLALASLAALTRKNVLVQLSGTSLSQWSTKSHQLFRAKIAACLEQDAPTQVEVYPWLAHHVFTTMMETFYGPELASAQFEADLDALDSAFTALYMGIPAKWKKVDAPRDRLLLALEDYVTKNIDHVSPLARDRWQGCQEHDLPPRDQAAHQLNMIWAMTFNTVRTAFWLLYYLQHTPNAWTAVASEIREHVNPEEWSTVSLQAQLQRCPLLDSAVKETLRLTMSSGFVRVAVDAAAMELGNGITLKVQPGDQVVLQAGVPFHDPKQCPDPSEFHVDRFMHMSPDFAKDFRPFGLGKFQCPGQFFATEVVKMSLATLVLETEISQFQGTVGADYSSPGSFAVKDIHAVRMNIRRSPSAVVA